MKNGGFDCIIGNPPYIRSIFLKESDEISWNIYKDNYESAKDNEFDIYLPFLEIGTKLLKKEGYLSYIMPNKWLHAIMGKNILQQNLKKLLQSGLIITTMNATMKA